MSLVGVLWIMTKEKRMNPVALTGLELKIPPVALWVAAAALVWFTGLAAPAFDFAIAGNVIWAVGLLLVGVLTSLAGVVSFRWAKTTVNPLKPDAASALVMSGVFRYSRNPMYLGFALTLLGWVLFVSNALAVLLLPAFMLYMNRFQISPEERALNSLFGEDYVVYCARVRRWL